jgi:hypothetical protein
MVNESSLGGENMTKCLGLLILIVPALLCAQSLNDKYMFPGDETWVEPTYGVSDSLDFSMGGMLGAVTIDGVAYSQVRLMPELAFWKIGLGLDIDLMFDSRGKLRTDNWDSWQDVVQKVLYFRYADRRDPFYLKAGCIPDYTLGNGMIFDDYSNMLRYPLVKEVGGYFGVNTKFLGAGVEAYTHDYAINDIIAGRLFFKPLSFMDKAFLKDLKLGVNVGADRNKTGKYPDADGDGYPDVYDKFPNDRSHWLDTDDDGLADDEDIDLNGNGILDHPHQNPYVNLVFPDIAVIYPNYPFDTHVVPDSAVQYLSYKPTWIFSTDYELPLIQGDAFSLNHYSELATIKDYGSGLIFPGFAAKFSIFEAKLELRHFGEKFLPAYFNNLYDEQRARVMYSELTLADSNRVYSLTFKHDLLDGIKASTGWFGYLKANLANVAYIKMAYQDMYGEQVDTGKSLWGKLTATPQMIKGLKEASVYYSQLNVPYVDFKHLRNENSQLAARIVYKVTDTADLICKYTEYYNDLNADGRIRGKDEIIETFTFGVEFGF